jgi:hypothetical protein
MATRTNFVTGFYTAQTGPNVGLNNVPLVGGTLAPGSSPLSGNSFNGYWISVQKAYNATQAAFTDYPYGTNNSSSAVNGGTVEIVRDSSNNNWLVKVNGTTALTLSTFTCAKYGTGANVVFYTPTGGTAAQFGIEANDDAPQITFTNGTQITSLQSKQGTGNYTNIPNPPLINADQNNVNWTSTYSNGTLTINK